MIDRYRQVLNRALGTAIITLDGRGRVTGWNEGARMLFAWTEAEMLGQSLERIFPEEKGGVTLLQREIADAATSRGGSEGWRIRKGGERFWAIGDVQLLSDELPEAGFVKVVRDRTEHRRFEAELREQARALDILNKTGAALAREHKLDVVVQTVTDAGVALTGAEFGAFFYNTTDSAGESYMLYTLSGVAQETFSKFPMPRNTAGPSEPAQCLGLVSGD